MCRISVGVPKENTNGTLMLADLLVDTSIFMSDRLNRDGFGIYLSNVGATDEYLPSMYKKAKACGDVINTDDFLDWLEENNSGFGPIICHVRQATYGKGNLLNDAFAHPFQHENLTLVHNGHLLNADAVRDRLKIPSNIVVDSEIFLRALLIMANGKPLDLNIIQKTVDLFVGPFVFVIHETGSDSVWLIIGKSRTLHYYDSDNFGVVLTDAGYSWLLTRGVNRTWYWNGLPNNHFEIAKKLEQDFVYKLTPRGLEKVGTIESVEDYPKPVVVQKPVGVGQQLPAPKSNGRTDPVTEEDSAFNLAKTRLEIEARNKLLIDFGFSQSEIELLLSELENLLPDDFYALELEHIELIRGFMESLGVKPEDNLRKTQIWLDVVKLITLEPGKSLVELAKEVMPNLLIPYKLNTIGMLEALLEEVK